MVAKRSWIRLDNPRKFHVSAKKVGDTIDTKVSVWRYVNILTQHTCRVYAVGLFRVVNSKVLVAEGKAFSYIG